jgi:hypothetical protein
MKFSDLTSDVARVDYLKAQLTQDDRLIMRCLLAIYNNQTLDEQSSKTVNKHNGIGFKSMDAKILTEYVQTAERRRVTEALENKNVEFCLERVLSEKQAAFLRRAMPKYARQLLKVIKEKQK